MRASVRGGAPSPPRDPRAGSSGSRDPRPDARGKTRPGLLRRRLRTAPSSCRTRRPPSRPRPRPRRSRDAPRGSPPTPRGGPRRGPRGTYRPESARTSPSPRRRRARRRGNSPPRRGPSRRPSRTAGRAWPGRGSCRPRGTAGAGCRRRRTRGAAPSRARRGRARTPNPMRPGEGGAARACGAVQRSSSFHASPAPAVPLATPRFLNPPASQSTPRPSGPVQKGKTTPSRISSRTRDAGRHPGRSSPALLFFGFAGHIVAFAGPRAREAYVVARGANAEASASAASGPPASELAIGRRSSGAARSDRIVVRKNPSAAPAARATTQNTAPHVRPAARRRRAGRRAGRRRLRRRRQEGKGLRASHPSARATKSAGRAAEEMRPRGVSFNAKRRGVGGTENERRAARVSGVERFHGSLNRDLVS